MNTKKYQLLMPLFYTTLLFVGVMGLTSRVLYLFLSKDSISFFELLGSLAKGTVFDLAVTLYVFLPITVLGLLPIFVWKKSWFQKALFIFFYVVSAILAWAALAEVFFVQEFNARFNFIAVDYLVYTNEVIKNLWESYPIEWILPAFLVVHFFFSRFIFRLFSSEREESFLRVKSLLLLALSTICICFFTEDNFLDGASSVEAEIAKNPVHALFAAYRNNEINFQRFYSSLDKKRAAHLVHEAFEEDIPGLSDNEGEDENETSIVRNIKNSLREKKLNVVVVLMESMSARFLKSFGADKELTPNLDQMAKDGIFFDHIYSTGTRTVRGIEAVTLSIPPTPGQSIVRRPDAGEIFNIGSVFREKGYETQFVYGGRAFFDNMSEFFSSNGFSVFDQGSMPENDITFSNAWGVCDEDLFHFALKKADEAKGKPFFQFILTTSNHRPYTYPDGRIDIPSHSGRDGAVKYADYAIGEYIKAAKQKSWFKNSIFVFVADHNASVAGGTKVLPYDYRIPLIFYSPHHFSPQRVSLLGSQIDVAPTIFGLLNFSYQSRFFGHDLMRARTERAFLATYQTVGMLQNNRLVLLSPNRKIEVAKVEKDTPQLLQKFQAKVGQKFADADVETTVGYYEAASDWFGEKLLKESKVADKKENLRIF